MKLSVIMPVYNEQNTLEKIVEQVTSLPIDMELIIVDDGSTDKTRDLLKKYSEDKKIKVILQERNRGKGFAIRTGLDHFIGDAVVIQDADLEYDPKELLKLFKPIEERKEKVVYGSRFMNEKMRKNQKLSFYLGSVVLTALANILYNAKITDEATCYKMFAKDVIDGISLKCERFEFCPEVTAKVRKKGYKIKELPITYSPRKHVEGKKINAKDGLSAAWTLIKYRFTD